MKRAFKVVSFGLISVALGAGGWLYFKKNGKVHDKARTEATSGGDGRFEFKIGPQDSKNLSKLSINIKFPIGKTGSAEELLLLSQGRMPSNFQGEYIYEGSGDQKETSCSAVEYLGHGLKRTRISVADWKWLKGRIGVVKRRLSRWLKNNEKAFPSPVRAHLNAQLEQLKWMPPPSLEDPQLSWRGIGTWIEGTKKSPLIRLGGGFLTLARKKPERAEFELARLMVQSWSPCILEKAKLENPWNPLLKCMGIESRKCNGQGYSPDDSLEDVWAVSTSIALRVSSSNCSVPFVMKPDVQFCLNSFFQQGVKNEK